LLFQSCSSPVRRASANVVSIIAKYAVPAGEWPDLLPFLFQCSQSAQEDHREVRTFSFLIHCFTWLILWCKISLIKNCWAWSGQYIFVPTYNKCVCVCNFLSPTLCDNLCVSTVLPELKGLLIGCGLFWWCKVALILFSSLTETIGNAFQPHFADLQALLLKCLQDDTSNRVRIAALK